MANEFYYLLEIYFKGSKKIAVTFENMSDVLFAVDMESRDSDYDYAIITKSNNFKYLGEKQNG